MFSYRRNTYIVQNNLLIFGSTHNFTEGLLVRILHQQGIFGYAFRLYEMSDVAARSLRQLKNLWTVGKYYCERNGYKSFSFHNNPSRAFCVFHRKANLSSRPLRGTRVN